MPDTMTAHETFLGLLVACTLKGTMFLLLVGMMALLMSSASRRHFTWACGFVLLGGLLVLEPVVPHWRLLPDWRPGNWFNTLRPWVLPVWIVGALLFCAKVVLGWLALVRIEKSSTELRRDPWDTMLTECRRDLGIHRPVHLLRFPGRIMPMTWGALRHFVILPSSAVRWSGQRLRAVLMHELAHVRRGDYLASLLRDFVCAFYWFHPLIWWAAREMDGDREEASDDAVIAAGQRPVSYAEHLAKVVTGHWGGRGPDLQVRPKVALAEKPILLRVRSILTPWKCRHPITWSQRLAIGMALAVMLACILVVGPRDSRPAPGGLIADSPSLVRSLPKAAYEPIAPTTTEALALAEPPRAITRWEPEPMDGKAEASGWPRAVALAGRHGGGAHVPPEGRQEAGKAVEEEADFFVASVPGLRVGARPTNGEEGILFMAPTKYSTSPPDESEDGPEVIDIDEVLASFENVGRMGVDEFDLGLLDDGNSADEEVAAGFDLGDFGLDGGTFTVASLKTEIVTRNVADIPVTGKSRGGEDLRRRTSAKFNPESESGVNPKTPLRVAAQTRPDAGLVTRVGVVKSRLTGESHLAITFRRKATAPTASFRFEASPDLQPNSWAFSPDLFIFAGVRSVSGQHEATIVLNEAMRVSPYRFLRIRSTSASWGAWENGAD